MININFLKNGLGETKVLVVPVWSDGKLPANLPEDCAITVHALIDENEFAGKNSEIVTELVELDESIIKLILVGLGDRAKTSPEQIKIAGAKAYLSVGVANEKMVTLLADEKITNAATILKLIEGFSLRNYLDDRYKTGEEKAKSESKIIRTLNLAFTPSAEFEKSLARLLTIINSTLLARDLVSAPPVDMKPDDLAIFAENIANEYRNVDTIYLNKREIEKAGLGLLAAVNRGSFNEPRLIIVTLNPTAKEDPIVLIGKGVTFDSGGYDIKSESGMRDMHCDMAGAATVLCAVQALAALGEKKKVMAIVPATENLVSGDAYKPSDIITSHAGHTVEIDNTDAEGRLILADAISYSKQFNPKVIIDLATLTGAAIVALGEKYSAVFSNRPELIKSLQKASDSSGDKIWPLPLDDSFREKLKSKLADIGNLAKGLDRKAGSSTGAAFLEYFAGGTPWVHLDIAGPAFQSVELEAWNPPSGASGYGVALLVDAVQNQLN